jgi:hypothetical protein
MEVIFILLAVKFALIAPKYIFAGLTAWIKKTFKVDRAKPFDCEACLSFWATIIAVFPEMDIVNGIACGLVSYFITEYIVKNRDFHDLEF